MFPLSLDEMLYNKDFIYTLHLCYTALINKILLIFLNLVYKFSVDYLYYEILSYIEHAAI